MNEGDKLHLVESAGVGMVDLARRLLRNGKPMTDRFPDRTNGSRRQWLCAVGVLGFGAVGCNVLHDRSVKTPAHSTGEPTDRLAGTVLAPLPKKPGKYFHRVSQYVFYSDFPLEPTDPLFAELEELPEQIQTELKLPTGSGIVQVFLFEDQEKYEAYIQAHYPKLPIRRAYFFAGQRGTNLPDDLTVCTWIGKHLRTDLRHELTHALLHGVLKAVPLWLDEGIAGVFEQPTRQAGVNASHLEALRSTSFSPNLARLEKLGQVHQMEKPEYQEAWAWVHFLLHSTPANDKILQDYLQALRQNPNPGLLLPKLETVMPEPGKAMLEHLSKLQLPALVVPVAGAR